MKELIETAKAFLDENFLAGIGAFFGLTVIIGLITKFIFGGK